MGRLTPGESRPLLINAGDTDVDAAVEDAGVGGRSRQGGLLRKTYLLAAVVFLQATAIAMTSGPQFAVFHVQGCREKHLPDGCTDDDAASVGSNRMGTWALSLNVVNFLVIAGLGELSDTVGRKPVLFVSLLGSGATSVGVAVCGASPGQNDLLLAITAATSLLGGPFAQTSAVFAMLGDLTTHMDEVERTITFGKVVFGTYFGLVAGSLLGGTLINEQVVTSEQCLLVAAGIFAFDAVLLLLCIPETRPSAARTRFNTFNANPFAGIAVLASDAVTRRVIFLEVCCHFGLVGTICMTVNNLTEDDKEFGSYFYAAFFFFVSAGNLLLPVVIKRFGIRGTIILGCSLFMTMPLQALAFDLGAIRRFVRPHYGIAASVISIPQIIGAMWDAPCRTLIVSRHPDKMVGLATAGLVGLQSISQGVASKCFLAASSYGTSQGVPWFGYAVAAGCCIFSLAFAISLPDTGEGGAPAPAAVAKPADKRVMRPDLR